MRVEICNTILKAPGLFLRYNSDRKRKGTFVMLQNLLKQGVLIYVMGLFLFIGFLAKIISAVTVRNLVKAAGEIQKSEHRLMKLVKAKFEHASMISDRVQNVEAFVDKYLYEYRVLGIRIHTWQTLPKLLLFIVSGIGVFTIFECFRMEGIGETTLLHVQWTGLFTLFLVLLFFVLEEKSKMHAAKNYMVDYLENVCVSRYMKKHRAEEAETEKVEEPLEEKETGQQEEHVETEKEEEKRKTEQEMRIRAILEEFLA